MSFRDFGLAEPLLRAVLQEGYELPTPIQQRAIPSVLKGRDVIGIAQTGTGKTAAFALPILHRLHGAGTGSEKTAGKRKVRVLVLASTRELAVQIHESFSVYGAFAGLRISTIYGGVGQQPQVAALRQGTDIVVATPGRLLDLIQQGCVNLKNLETLILDEADRMLDMGFFPAIRRILQHVPKERQTLMFSATMKPEIRELAESILDDPVSISVVPAQKTTELVEQSVCFVPQKQKTKALIGLLRQLKPTRAIVFSRTKHGADRIVRNLEIAGFCAAAIHANKSQNKRQRILEEFRSPRPPILVATDIAARGIDVDQVSHVFLHEMPTEEETYVHRIGRSGRAGSTGVSISLCDPEERRMLRSIEKLIGMKIPERDLSDLGLESVSESNRSEENERRSRSAGGHTGDRSTDRREPRNHDDGDRGRRRPLRQRNRRTDSSRSETRTASGRSAPSPSQTSAPSRPRNGGPNGRSPSSPGVVPSSGTGKNPRQIRTESGHEFGSGVDFGAGIEVDSPQQRSASNSARRRRRQRPASSVQQ